MHHKTIQLTYSVSDVNYVVNDIFALTQKKNIDHWNQLLRSKIVGSAESQQPFLMGSNTNMVEAILATADWEAFYPPMRIKKTIYFKTNSILSYLDGYVVGSQEDEDSIPVIMEASTITTQLSHQPVTDKVIYKYFVRSGDVKNDISNEVVLVVAEDYNGRFLLDIHSGNIHNYNANIKLEELTPEIIEEVNDPDVLKPNNTFQIITNMRYLKEHKPTIKYLKII